MTCFSRQSGCTRLRLDTFRVSPSPNGARCKATPSVFVDATLTCAAFLAEAEGSPPGHDYIMHGVHARVKRNEVPLHYSLNAAICRCKFYLLPIPAHMRNSFSLPLVFLISIEDKRRKDYPKKPKIKKIAVKVYFYYIQGLACFTAVML